MSDAREHHADGHGKKNMDEAAYRDGLEVLRQLSRLELGDAFPGLFPQLG